MATSSGGLGGLGLVPVLGVVAVAGPAAVAMSLAFSEPPTVVARSHPGDAMETQRTTTASGPRGAGFLSGQAGSSRPLNPIGDALPASRDGGDAGMPPAQLPENASRQQQTDEPVMERAGADPAPMNPPAAPTAPVGRMAMLEGGQANAGLGGSFGGFSSFGGSGGGASSSGGSQSFGGAAVGGGAFGEGASAGAPISGQPGSPSSPAAASAPGSSNSSPQPSEATLTPPPAPQAQPPAPPADPPAGGPGPIVLGPGDVLKGSGPDAPVTNDGGTLAAGNSPGEMALPGDYVQNDGTTEVEIWGLTGPGECGDCYDFYDVENDAIFNGGTISFVFIAGFDFSDSFELAFLTADGITFGDDFLGVTFAGTVLDPNAIYGLDGDIFDIFVEDDDQGRERLVLSYLAFPLQQSNDQQDGGVAQAPEPETLFLFGLGLLCLAAARRRLA